MIRLFPMALRAAVLVSLCSYASADDAIDFAGQIKPLLQKHCLDCHGPDEQNGGLRLDRFHAATAEADSGSRAIVPGDADASELIVRVKSTFESDQMPPEGPRLSDEAIASLRAWINAGANWDSEPDGASETSDGSDHWSFQPIREVVVPEVDDPHWAWGDIDRLIQSRRESAGMDVVGDADPVALIRRATYGVTGLPPSVEEVDRFKSRVSDVGIAVAMAELADELLSRPSYGQRWGRHWMDWVRYADTAGDNSDYPIPQAYLYRNYIIDSLNQDLPYDQFLTEQIAGDLLPADSLDDRNRQVIATGYLAMARRFGSLVERYPWHLTIEDTIDNVGRTMMGLTIACARCHDHKFDPITARDYYGLYGIFESTRYPFPGIELFKSQWDFVSLLDEAETQKILGQHQDETEKLVAELERHLALCEAKAIENAELEKSSSLDQQRRMHDKLESMLIKARQAGERLAKHLRELPEIPTAYAVSESKPTDASIQIKGEPSRPGATVRRGFPEILGGWKLDPSAAAQTSGRRELAQWITHPNNPLTARVIVNRVWQRHFGTGIVASTSDFGLRGQTPSHPGLLDFLARDFIENGWSLKRLHQQILTSHTYALSSEIKAKNQQADPNNRLRWRFDRRRLDAESIRDSLMTLAGTLDATPQTQPYPFPPRKDWKFTQHHPFKDDYPSDKRSVYLMTKRLTAKPYFQTFDGPDPNVCTSQRDESVTALQALYFVNDRFLHKQSEHFARLVLSSADDTSSRINFAVGRVLSRSATPQERELFETHLGAVRSRMPDPQSSNADQAAWASLSRSLFRLNEFLYLD